MSKPIRIFASKAEQLVIGIIDETDHTTHCGWSFKEVREKHPDAEIMDLDEFCAWKGALQRTPIEWFPSTEERFDYGLNVLPPAAQTDDFQAFLVGEPVDHEVDTGRPRYEGHRHLGGKYEVTNRPITIKEFKEEALKAQNRLFTVDTQNA